MTEYSKMIENAEDNEAVACAEEILAEYIEAFLEMAK